MSHHLRTLQLPPLSWKTPTINTHSFSLHCFRFSFGFHCSVSCGCARQISPVRFSHQASLQEEGKPVSLFFQPVSSETHFDLLLDQAQRLHQAVVVVWLQFYSVDVNTVSHKLVARAGVTKMPTIQLWKDSKKQAEVIGGHKAHIVISEIQEMIENE
ncbi:thioredoxin-like 3-2, chloroplastic isoform X2 [Vigna umbellata]|uniref:thioredoxin-like 3-2, chloroplastic isoform X2 n=1 Tax=Vigna umbellata TaxID=87088 RepID=UPI001F5FAC01|nr:thioredoxin-like 3-2, chloroplastic isoform X2 [Vigna umbellata]